MQLLRQAARSGYPSQLIPPKPEERTTIRKSTQATFAYQNLSIDIGDFKDVLRQQRAILGIEVEGTLQDDFLGPVQLRYDTEFIQNGVSAHSGWIRSKQGMLGWDWGKHRSSEPITLPLFPGLTLHFQSTAYIHTPIVSSGWNGQAATPEQRDRAEAAGTAIQNAISRFLLSIHSTYGIRGFEERGYHIADATQDFEHLLLDDRALALSTAFPYNRDIEDKASDWLESLLGVRIRFEMVGSKRVILKTTRRTETRGSHTLIVNEGLGLQQLLFILLPIAITPSEGTVLIEEPEAHLYPKAQAALARLFSETAREQKKQIIMTTHSEHFIVSLLTEVAQGKLTADDLAIYHFDHAGGATQVRLVPFDSAGRVAGGLPGFFEHRAHQLLDLLNITEGDDGRIRRG